MNKVINNFIVTIVAIQVAYLQYAYDRHTTTKSGPFYCFLFVWFLFLFFLFFVQFVFLLSLFNIHTNKVNIKVFLFVYPSNIHYPKFVLSLNVHTVILHIVMYNWFHKVHPGFKRSKCVNPWWTLCKYQLMGCFRFWNSFVFVSVSL